MCHIESSELKPVSAGGGRDEVVAQANAGMGASVLPHQLGGSPCNGLRYRRHPKGGEEPIYVVPFARAHSSRDLCNAHNTDGEWSRVAPGDLQPCKRRSVTSQMSYQDVAIDEDQSSHIRLRCRSRSPGVRSASTVCPASAPNELSIAAKSACSSLVSEPERPRSMKRRISSARLKPRSFAALASRLDCASSRYMLVRSIHRTIHQQQDPRDRFLRRFVQLWVGLFLFGASIAMMIRAGLGLASWDVFHQGLAGHTGLPFGWIVIGISLVVLLFWIPLRQMPGLGTLCNAVGIGLIVDASLGVIPSVSAATLRILFLVVGILINGVATALYIGAGLGPGARDGLMTGLAKRGLSIRLARTCIELTVLVIGWFLGGSVGVGTVLYAISIGPLVHYLLPRLSVSLGNMAPNLPVRRPPDAATNRPPHDYCDGSVFQHRGSIKRPNT